MIELLKIIKTIQKKKLRKKICFFLGNTKKFDKKKFFFTPIRENKNFIFFGAIVYSDKISKKILKIIDGKVDLILIDIEKKIEFKKIADVQNIERTAKDLVKKSEIHLYKANDLAVTAAETLLFNFFLKDKRGLGGKKILILGVGNIGFKLALKFVECGSKIYIYRRRRKILKTLSHTINIIKPQGVISRVKIMKKIPENFKNYDVVLTTANNVNIVTLERIKNIKKKIIFVDIGKGNFDVESVKELNKKNINIYRLDTTSAYFSYLDNIYFTKNQYNSDIYKKKINKLTFVQRGIVGEKNDIIVDDVKMPKKIFGVCDGKGNLINYDFVQKKKLIKKIFLIVKKKLSYD
jgi:hypothetical protein